MPFVQGTQRVDDLERAVPQPDVIYRHADPAPGPAGTDGCLAAVREGEGNLVGLVEQRSSW